MNSVAFFNNRGGVGQTSLVYHLAWMFAERGVPVLAVDLDPQADLTAMFLDEERLIALWDGAENATVFDSLKPLISRTGDIAPPHVELLAPNLGLLPGNPALSRFEDSLSENWPKCLAGEEAAFRVITAFHRLILAAADQSSGQADLVLIDVGPNLGAINRAALIAAQHVVVPLAPDLFSFQGLKNLGPTLREWRIGWKKRLEELPADANVPVPEGSMQPAGYVVMQDGVRDSRPVRAHQRWIDWIPKAYREAVLDDAREPPPPVAEDPHRLALLKHYRSLMPFAMDARKPMFFLKPADGAIGAHVEAVRRCHEDFSALAARIAAFAGLSFPQ